MNLGSAARGLDAKLRTGLKGPGSRNSYKILDHEAIDRSTNSLQKMNSPAIRNTECSSHVF